MSKADLPPVPPAGRGEHRPGPAAKRQATADAAKRAADKADPNAAKRGRQGNIKQNTTHQGYKQDR